ncbi:MAG: c-type cytochrome [Rhodomicrobiaceae bacterium]
MLGAALLLAASTAPAAALDGGDATKGGQVFKKCMACHRIGPNAKNLVGPVLTGVVGRKAGTYDEYHYSDLNKHAGENGLVWTDDLIFEYLPDPNAFLKKFLTDAGKADLAKGTTKMTFRLKDEQERKDVIAYLKTFSSK